MNKKICPKSKISNFTILLKTLVDTLPRSVYMNVGANLVHILSEQMLSETFISIRSHVNYHEYEKKNVKNPKFYISQFFEQLW